MRPPTKNGVSPLASKKSTKKKAALLLGALVVHVSLSAALILRLYVQKQPQEEYSVTPRHRNRPCNDVMSTLLSLIDPGEINHFRRSIAADNPFCYEHSFPFLANYTRSRLDNVKNHLFLHIPKAGGTSLCGLAKKVWGRKATTTNTNNCFELNHFWALWAGPDSKFAPGDRSEWLDENNKTASCDVIDSQLPKIVMNENYLDHPMCLSNRLHSVLLRDPLSRVESHEKHLLYNIRALKRKHQRERLVLIRNNYVTWAMTAGSTEHGRRFLLKPSREHLAIAKETLSRFDFLLELSRDSECDAAILKLMGLGERKLPHSQSSSEREAKHPQLNFNTTLSREEYKEKNLLDIELYEYAKSLMDIDCEFFVRLVESQADVSFLGRSGGEVKHIQRLVDQYFDGISVVNPAGMSSESNFALNGCESLVVRCDDEENLNSTCLFSNIYVPEGTSTPSAYVIKGSPSANRFKNLPRLQYYGTYDRNDKIQVIEYETEEQLIAAAKEADRFPSDLTAAFTTYWPHNIGHGIFDGIWGIFVGLVRMGLKDDAKFHPYLVRCGKPNEKEFGLNNFGEGVVSEIYRALSLEDSLSSCKPGRLGNHSQPTFRFPLFVHGNGHLGQRNMNAQYELPGGRIAMRKFRDRIFSGMGILPTKKRAACPWENTKLEANIFDNKRYSTSERSSIMDVVSTNFPNVSVHFIDWSELKTTREQIQKVADTDIYISGPGTGLVLSAFLTDGSIVINLGEKSYKIGGSENFPIVSYMEEYFAASSPHLRALYYDRCSYPDIDSQELTKLIHNADGIARSCFHTSNVGYDSNVNKSPFARAYSYVFNKMVDGLGTIPRYFYTTRFDHCDWAEEFIFESVSCMRVLEEYGWDKKKYRLALQESLEMNKIEFRQCRRPTNNQACEEAGCAFSQIKTQVNVTECLLHGEGQGGKAVPYESGCVVEMSARTGVQFSPLCNTTNAQASKSLHQIKLPRLVDFLKMDIEGHEWEILENRLPVLWKEDDTLLPDLISVKLHTKYANPKYGPQKVVKDKGRDEVNNLFLLLSEMGYYVISKDIDGGNPACCNFVVGRLNPKSTSMLRHRLIGHGCKLRQSSVRKYSSVAWEEESEKGKKHKRQAKPKKRKKGRGTH